MNDKPVIFGVNGPIITVTMSNKFKMSEMVRVGNSKLIGEVIRIDREYAIVQVYEESTGLKKGEPVENTGTPLSITLGPGMLKNIFDGIGSPLKAIAEATGNFIKNGVHVDDLDAVKKWNFKVNTDISEGDVLKNGQILGSVEETSIINHKIMLPPNISGKLVFIAKNGSYTINDKIATVEDENGHLRDITMCHKWPVRKPRPITLRQQVNRPLVTGQRIIDTLFPVAKGGMAALPGGFGTGKTMNQHQLAKWSDADIIIYIGCGERGNEMTQVLEEFSELEDPRNGKKLMERTVLIANTSNMPVAAREASIYTGITMAEYFRDMGYHVAIMADSTSRWAEALRELSGRLEEMPAEEGFPAYLASRLSEFYERAGYVTNLNGQDSSVTIIGAVSPQGGDFSEPVTQNTKRFVRSFWTLDRSLAYARHFPAINWLTSYSEYLDDLAPWYNENVSPRFLECRGELLKILQEEKDLLEIVKLIGADVLPDNQKLTLEVARIVRLGYLQQNAYHAFDTYVPFDKQMRMMEVILYFDEKAKELMSYGIPMRVLKEESVIENIIAMKYNVGNDDLSEFDKYLTEIDKFYDKIYSENM